MDALVKVLKAGAPQAAEARPTREEAEAAVRTLIAWRATTRIARG